MEILLGDDEHHGFRCVSCDLYDSGVAMGMIR